MKITGLITNVMPMQTGVSEQGNEWRRQSMVVREDDPQVAFPDEMVLDVWNDRIPEEPLAAGQRVEVFFSVKTRSYNGRMYNDFNVFKIKRL